MNKKKFRRIPTFREYCKGEKKLKENAQANIKVEIDWWQDCIDIVLNELRLVSGGDCLDWEMLVDYCRARLLILGREVPLFVEEIVLTLIRDLVFQNFGSALYSSDKVSDSAEDAALGTRILVVSQISDEILHKAKLEAGIEVEPEKPVEDPNTVVSVSLGDGCADDDLPFEHKSPLHNMNPNKNRVTGFADFDKAINEAYCGLQMEHFNTVVEKCLKDLVPEQENGTLDYDKLLKRAKKEVEGEKNDDRCIYKFLRKLAKEHMENEQITVDGIDFTDITFSKVEVLKAAQNLFIYHIIEEILGRVGK